MKNLPRVPGPARLLAFALLAVLAPQPLRAADAFAPLFRKLEAGQPVQIAAVGDTITFGGGLVDATTEAYPKLLAQALNECYEGARVSVATVAMPDFIAERAADLLPSHIRPLHADLAIIELGRTDAARKTDGYATERALRRLVETLAGDGAGVVLCCPPLDDNNEHNQVARIIRAVGAQTGVPIADFHACLRERGYDTRGAFAWGRPPNEYAHALFAQTVWESIARAHTGRPLPGVSASFAPLLRQVPAGTPLSLPLALRAPAGAACTYRAGTGGAELLRLAQGMGMLAAGEKAPALAVPVPALPDRGRTTRVPLWCTAHAGDDHAFALRWLTVAPLLRCADAVPPLSPDELFAPSDASLTLTPRHAVLGTEMIAGDADLSARVAAYRHREGDGDDLRLFVRVRDDRVVTEDKPEATNYDCVEFHIDARAPDAQAKPYYEPGVVVIFVRPASEHFPKTQMSTLDAAPARFDQVRASSALLDDGYLVCLTIPLAVLNEWAHTELQSIGFDVAVDDADSFHGRESQIRWAAGSDTVSQPHLLGALSWSDADRTGMARVSVR